MATAKKKTAKPSAKAKKIPKEKVIGKAEHFYDKINVVTTTLKNPLKVGDLIHIKGHTTDMVQTVESIQIEHQKVLKAKKGDGVGIKVYGPVRDTDIIYLADKKSAFTPHRSEAAPDAQKVVLNFQKMRDQIKQEPQQKKPTAPFYNPVIPRQAMPKVAPFKRVENAPKSDTGTKFFNF